MLSPPSAQEIRPSGNGQGSIQGGEEVGIIYRTLGTASLWELEDRKINQYRRMRSGCTLGGRSTNRGVYEVIVQYIHSARRCLGDGCVTESELLDQRGIVTE